MGTCGMTGEDLGRQGETWVDMYRQGRQGETCIDRVDKGRHV